MTQVGELYKNIAKKVTSVFARLSDAGAARREISFLSATENLLRLSRDSRELERNLLLQDWTKLVNVIAKKDPAHARLLVDNAVVQALPGTPFRAHAMETQRKLTPAGSIAP